MTITIADDRPPAATAAPPPLPRASVATPRLLHPANDDVAAMPTLRPPAGALRLREALVLESGALLPDVTIAYRTWGTLDAARDNAVVVCHALTGDADVATWWAPLFGAGRALDPTRDFIIATDVLGGCGGTTGPRARAPDGRRWGARFPRVTIRDQVAAQVALVDALGVRRVRAVIGGSMGGLQALEWAVLARDRVDTVVTIAASARHSPWCIAWSEAQRGAIAADPAWRDGHYDDDAPPRAGLAAARAIAMISYRSPAALAQRFDRATGRDAFGTRARAPDDFAVGNWLRHHGDALVRRFDANAYATLTHALDSHDLARGRGTLDDVLGAITQPVLVVSIPSDALYVPADQHDLVARLPRGELAALASRHGHDGFLIDAPALDGIVSAFRARHAAAPSVVAPTSRAAHAAPCVATVAPRVDVVLVGARGAVATAWRRQLAAAAPAWRAAGDVDVRLSIAFDRHGLVAADDGLAPSLDDASWHARRAGDVDALLARADRAPTIIVDCTASTEIAAHYGDWLAAGHAIATPNKHAGAGDLATWQALQQAAAAAGGASRWRYETTVGAAIPVLATLRALRDRGEAPHRIEAVLSGSLSFVLARLHDGVAFTDAVAQARARGFTEPDPREDLSARDVARKLVILAREAGVPLAIDAVDVTPLVDVRHWRADVADPALDARWAARVAAAAQRDQRLVLVATLADGAASVAVRALPTSSPLARVVAGENLVRIHTAIHDAIPLTLAGPGAGAAVTAAGLIGDVHQLARDLSTATRRARTPPR